MGAANAQWQPHLGTTGFLVDDPRKEQAGIVLGLILRWVLKACQSMISGGGVSSCARAPGKSADSRCFCSGLTALASSWMLGYYNQHFKQH